MTLREKFILALENKRITGLVPHFELVFFLTLEAVGRIHPLHRSYLQWEQMSKKEKKLQINDIALSYIEVAQKYEHSAIFVHPISGMMSDYVNGQNYMSQILEEIRNISGDIYFLMIHGDPTLPIPDGESILDFSVQMFEKPHLLHEKSKVNLENMMRLTDIYANSGLLDGFALCSDYCFNANPFYNPEMFDEFIAPYLTQCINGFITLAVRTKPCINDRLNKLFLFP